MKVCLLANCGRPIKPGKPASTGKKMARRKRAFCKLHSGLRTQMKKDAYNELRKVFPPRRGK